MTQKELSALRKRVGTPGGTARYVALAAECVEVCEALEAALRVVEMARKEYIQSPELRQALIEFYATYPELAE